VGHRGEEGQPPTTLTKGLPGSVKQARPNTKGPAGTHSRRATLVARRTGKS
jgi:hypothetical protein